MQSSDEPSRWSVRWSRAFPWVVGAALAAVVALACGYGWSLAHYGVKGARGVRIFYDQYHVSRHKVEGRNKRGAWAYHHVSGYHEFRKTLERAGYEFHVHRNGPIRPGMLDDYDIFVIGEQTHHAEMMTPEEREVVFEWIEAGGGMWATIEHTNAHEMTDHWNPWMEGTGIQARKDSICEPNGTVFSRDWVGLLEFADHPLTEGVEAVYTCNGCSFDTEHGIAFSAADSWSDAWNPDDPPVYNGDNDRNEGELAGPLAGLAAVEYGEGRIAVTCDHNIFSNPTLYIGSHYRFLHNAMRWLGGERWNPDALNLGLSLVIALVLAIGALWRRVRWLHLVVWAALGAAGGSYLSWQDLHEPGRRDILFTDSHAPDIQVRSKDVADLFTFFEHVMKDEHTYAWLGLRLEPGYDALFLTAPTEPLDDDDLAVVQGYLDRGRPVVYVASTNSLTSPAGRQLLERYGIGIELKRQDRAKTRAFRIRGDRALTARTKKMRVVGGTRVATIEGDGVEVLVRLVDGETEIDFIASKPVGDGRFVVIAQAELLGNRNIKVKEHRLGLVDLSMNLARWLVE